MKFKTWLENKIPTILRRSHPAGMRTLYHGTILSKYLRIVSEGKIRSWSGDEGVEKSSTGDMFETGLIWFFDDKSLALTYAHGREYKIRKKEFAAGGIIEVDVPRTLKLVDRHMKLNAEQAATLVPHYPKYAQSYKPIKAGLGLNYAVWRLWEHGHRLGFGDVLKLLGLDGIIYEGDQIGIAAKELPVAAAYPV